jgi:hypothetical protein
MSSPVAGVVVPAAVRLSSSDGGGVEPPSKRSRPWSFLLASARYVCGAEFRGMLFPLSAFWIPGFEGSIGLNGRSRTLLVLVIRQQPVVLVALAMEVPGVGGAPWGIVGTEMSGASIPERAAPAGAASAPGCSGAMRPELFGPYLPDSSDSMSPLINWRWVESEVELACSQVTTAERLLHLTLALVHCNILCQIQVSLGKKNEKSSPYPKWLPVLTCFLMSCSHRSYLRVAKMLSSGMQS